MRGWGKNLGIKGVAFVITFFLCLNAETDRMVEVACTLPVTYVNLPDSLVRMDGAPVEAQVRVIFNRKFWQVAPGNLIATIDLGDAVEGIHAFALTPQDVSIPHDRKARVVEVVEPRRIPIRFEKKIRKRVKVFPMDDGVPAEQFVLFGNPRVEPEWVDLIGAESFLSEIDAVYTEQVSLAGLTDDLTSTITIDQTQLEGIVIEPARVEVFFNIEKIEDRILKLRPIRTSPRYGSAVQPDSLDLVVRGPAAMLSEIPESRVRLSLNVSSLQSGDHIYLAEVDEGNRVRYTPRPPNDGEEGEPVLPVLEGSIQNLPDQVVLIDFSPKIFHIVRGAP